MRGAAPQLSLFPEHDWPGAAPGFDVRESTRARRLSIKVYPRGRVEVVVPRRTPPNEVEAFVSENVEWIRRARDSFALEHPPQPFRLPDWIDLRAAGKVVSVQYRPKRGSKSVRFRSKPRQVALSGRISNDRLCVASLRRWLTATARQEFGPRLEALSGLTGMPYDSLQIRAQRSCWGSRSNSGTISLNLCLLFLEPELVRYLMIHELCHGRHMNHSKSFWRLVSRFEPEYRSLDRKLTECWDRVPGWLGIY
ncbi:MAG: M48 family metallopeptidase [Woeseia sp.]